MGQCAPGLLHLTVALAHVKSYQPRVLHIAFGELMIMRMDGDYTNA